MALVDEAHIKGHIPQPADNLVTLLAVKELLGADNNVLLLQWWVEVGTGQLDGFFKTLELELGTVEILRLLVPRFIGRRRNYQVVAFVLVLAVIDNTSNHNEALPAPLNVSPQDFLAPLALHLQGLHDTKLLVHPGDQRGLRRTDDITHGCGKVNRLKLVVRGVQVIPVDDDGVLPHDEFLEALAGLFRPFHHTTKFGAVPDTYAEAHRVSQGLVVIVVDIDYLVDVQLPDVQFVLVLGGRE